MDVQSLTPNDLGPTAGPGTCRGGPEPANRPFADEQAHEACSAPNKANSPGSWRPREIRSTKLEIRNKFEMRMIETDQSAPNEANFRAQPGRAERPEMPNKANSPLSGMKTRVRRENRANLPALGRAWQCASHRQAGACRCHPGARGRECQTNPIYRRADRRWRGGGVRVYLHAL